MEIDDIRQVLTGFEDVSFATLFGSRAEGRARPDSDWDIAVYLAEDLDKDQRFRVHRRIAAALAPAIEANVVILNDASSLLAHRALGGQLLLRRAPELWVRFFVRTMSRYMDEAYWRDFFLTRRRQQAAENRHG
jgi:uncharacterized protein